MRSVWSECLGKSWCLEMQTHGRTGCGRKLVKLLKLCGILFPTCEDTSSVHLHVGACPLVLVCLLRFCLFVYTAVLGFRCCTGFSLVAVSGGDSLIAGRGLLTAVASPVAERVL